MEQHLENPEVSGQTDVFEKKMILCAWGRVQRVSSGQGTYQEGPDHVKEHALYPEYPGETVKEFKRVTWSDSHSRKICRLQYGGSAGVEGKTCGREISCSHESEEKESDVGLSIS